LPAAEQAEHMAAPTKAANVKKVLANSEPSTHDPKRTLCSTLGLAQLLMCGSSCKTTFSNELWISMRPLQAIKPNFEICS
jgi:hypothetical protein